MHRFDRTLDRFQQMFQTLSVAGFRGIQAVMQHSQTRSGLALDIDVNEYEPLFVDAARKSLDQCDIPAFEFLSGVEAEEIMQSVAAVAQDRRSPEPFRDGMPRHSEVLRQYLRRPRATPDVSVAKITEQCHRTFQFVLVGYPLDREGWKIFNGAPEMVRYEQLRQRQSCLFPHIERSWKTDQRILRREKTAPSFNRRRGD